MKIYIEGNIELDEFTSVKVDVQGSIINKEE